MAEARYTHPENLTPGHTYTFLVRDRVGDLVAGLATFQGLELHKRQLHVAVKFHDDAEVGVERWVPWQSVVQVMDPHTQD